MCLVSGRKEGLTSLQARERGDLWGLKARACAALGEKEAALDALEEMTARRMALLSGGEERAETVLFQTFGRGVIEPKREALLLRAQLRRELMHPALRCLCGEERWKALAEQVEALAAE
jgi:hypothetical protein